MLAIAAMYLGLVATPYACPPTFAVDARTMGPLALGQPISAVRATYNTSAQAFEDDGNGGVLYRVAICGDTDILATTEARHTTINELSTESPRFMTAKGAHAGMTVAELKRLYPGGELNILIGEGAVANFDTRTGVIFDLDSAAVPHRCYDYGVDCTTDLRAFKSIAVHIRAW